MTKETCNLFMNLLESSFESQYRKSILVELVDEGELRAVRISPKPKSNVFVNLFLVMKICDIASLLGLIGYISSSNDSPFIFLY